MRARAGADDLILVTGSFYLAASGLHELLQRLQRQPQCMLKPLKFGALFLAVALLLFQNHYALSLMSWLARLDD